MRGAVTPRTDVRVLGAYGGHVLVRLDSGSSVTIRPIRPDDKVALADSHGRLSAETQRRRFLAPKPRLTSADLRYLTEIDGLDHVALVAVTEEDPEEIVAVGRFVRLPDSPDTAEFAIVVGDAYQGQGLGRALAITLADAARARGVKRFAATVFSDNHAIHRLLQTIGSRLDSTGRSGEVEELLADLAA